MKTGLLKIENQLIQMKAEHQAKKIEFESYSKQYAAKFEELHRQKGMVMNGLDLDRIKNAEGILRFKGLKDGIYNERCVQEAINDIASGTNKMAKAYFGVKNYAGYKHQSCDCNYGYGPTHGCVVFSVGLNNPREPLTDDQKEDCLYLLNLLKDKESRDAIAKPKEAV